jgi:hypothetical protein
VIPTEIAPSPPASPTFPRDVAEFLLELSIGVHRYAMYPHDHPSLRPVAASVLRRLEGLLAARASVRIGVLRDCFVMGDGESDRRHPVLRTLAARLHDHEIASVSFHAGVDAREIRELLGRIAPDVDRGAWPLGQRERADAISWPHISIEPLAYDELTLTPYESVDGEARAEELWASLVRSTVGEAHLADGDLPTRLARALAAQKDDALQVRLVGGYLAPLVDTLAKVDHDRLGGIRAGLSEFLRSLDPPTRFALLAHGGDANWRRDLMGSASHALDRDALLEMLDSAAEASGQTISTSMTRLLTKLATHGGDIADERAEGAIRQNVRTLLDDWTLADPNPAAYSRMLDRMARAAPDTGGGEDSTDAADIAQRLLAMSLEVDQWTPKSERALIALLDHGRLRSVFEALDQLPGNRAADGLQDALHRPAIVRRAVNSEQLEGEALDRLARAAGPGAIPPLVDGLVAARTREARRVIFNTLVTFGSALIPEVTARLPSPYWYVTRNLLNLLSSVPGNSNLDSLSFLEHVDPRVRRAALALALQSPDSAESALVRALSDGDERLAQHALVHFRATPTPGVMRAVLTRVVLAGRSSELRILGIRAMEGYRSPLVRECLLEVVVRAFHADPDTADDVASVAAAALDCLRRGWPGAPDIQGLLRTAATSRSPILRAAAGGS